MEPTLGRGPHRRLRQATLPGQRSGAGGSGTTGGTRADHRRRTGTGTLNAAARALIARANTQFQAAQKALQAGDFAEYGRQVKALQNTLRAAAEHQVGRFVVAAVV